MVAPSGNTTRCRVAGYRERYMAGKAGAHVPKTSKSGKSPSGGIDWMMVGAVVVVVALVAGLAIYLVPRFLDKRAEEEAARIAPETISEFVPTPANPDPSDKIDFRPLDPPLSFGVYCMHLEDRPLSSLAEKFIRVMTEVLANRAGPGRFDSEGS